MKICVPRKNQVDGENLASLLDVALGPREPIQWEGSAWQGGQNVLNSDRLRYALLTPRLIAPHQNHSVTEFAPDEAIAALMRMRLDGLQPSRSPFRDSKVPDITVCRSHLDWRWRFFAALYDCLADGKDADSLTTLLGWDGAGPAERAAAAAMSVAVLVEAQAPHPAIDVVESVLKLDDCSPVDHAWLLIQHSRCFAEIGEIDRAIAQAIEVQALRRTHLNDPTAMAIVGAGADLIFSLSDWGASPIADVVAGTDTLAAWWRTQEIASGLEFKAAEDFKTWAHDRSVS